MSMTDNERAQFYLALNMLNDLSWIIIHAGNPQVSADAMDQIEALRKVITMSLTLGARDLNQMPDRGDDYPPPRGPDGGYPQNPYPPPRGQPQPGR